MPCELVGDAGTRGLQTGGGVDRFPLSFTYRILANLF